MSQLGVQEKATDHPEATWINLQRRQGGVTESLGRILVTLEILPKRLAETTPAGFGRAEPNENPRLPPPEGRPDIKQVGSRLDEPGVCAACGLRGGAIGVRGGRCGILLTCCGS
jgi:hypothetical protein